MVQFSCDVQPSLLGQLSQFDNKITLLSVHLNLHIPFYTQVSHISRMYTSTLILFIKLRMVKNSQYFTILLRNMAITFAQYAEEFKGHD